MSKYLFIIESPGKKKKIQSFLGGSYLVIPTYGHIMDLHPKKISVDIKKDFKPTYEVNADKKAIVKKIKEEAGKAEIVYIATDLDREGALIANGVISILPKDTIYKRVEYSSITKKGILDGIKNAGKINSDLVNSAECRRILDRLVGWKASFPTKQATGGRSAGRVQSAALRILAEREKEIQSFIPEEYWPIEVDLQRENGEKITAMIKVPKSLQIKNEKESNNIVDVLRKEKWIVSKYETKEKSTKAYPPFTTSTMYQSGSSILGWSSKKTAQVAQQLYESGLCTYIRSDSTYIVPEFVNTMRSSIPVKYGESYLPSKANYFSNKSNAQEAHESIRVIDLVVENAPGADTNKLYNIIWKRTMASQISNMIQFVGSAEFQCDKYIFGASGSRVIFDGWRKVWNYGSLSDTVLPEFEVGEELKFLDVRTEQKFTTPPPRYTESSLTKELEKRGIGRPSTYASIPNTLFDRKYIEKEKNTIYVTDMGVRVSDFLVDTNFCFVDIDFTSEMENNLDCIASGDCNKLDILNNFWNRLKSDIENAKIKRVENSKTEFKCPKCGGFLEKKFSQYGPFLSCENRNNKENKCDYKCDVDEDGKPKEKEKNELNESDFTCPNCGKKLLIRVNKKGGEYLGCRSWQQPDCKGFYNAETGEKIIFKKKSYKRKWKKK
jgi:DNA topoisomerase I